MHITIAGLLPNHSPVPAWIAAIPTFLPAPGPKLALTAIAHAIHHSSALCSTQKASTQPNRAERSYRTWHQAYLPHTTCISLKYPYGEAKSLPTPPRLPWRPFLSPEAGATSPEANKDCKGADCWVLQLYLLTLSLQLPFSIPHFSWQHQLSHSQKGGCLLPDTVPPALRTPSPEQPRKARAGQRP